MKNFLLVPLAMLLMNSAFGQSNSAAQIRQKITELTAVFNTGSVFPSSEITGWFSGQCYRGEVNYTADYAAVLVGYTEQNHPMLPAGQQFKMTLVLKGDEVLDYYDVLTPAMEADIRNTLARDMPLVHPATVFNDSIAGYDGGANLMVRKTNDPSHPFVLSADLGDILRNQYRCTFSKRIK